MIFSIFVLAAIATGAAAETFSGTATMNNIWSGVACGGNYDMSKYLIALKSVQYGTFPNPNNAPVCGHTITVNNGGKSLVATVVDRGLMGVNNFDLDQAAFEFFAPVGDGHFAVTWSWNGGFDPATGTQDKAGLEAVAVAGATVGGSAAAAVTSPVAAVGTSVASTPASGTTTPAAAADAAAEPADTSIASVPAVAPVSTVPVAPVDPTAAPVAPSAASVPPAVPAVSSAASSAAVGRPTGHRGGGRQSRRCAAQL